MKFVSSCLCLGFLVLVARAEYTYTTKYIDVPLDHFSFAQNTTFKLRYLVNDTYHVERGPIFFYTGNEGDINLFAQNTGFINDIAEQFGALIVFAEHRYYGSSLPFGNNSYESPKYLGFLSSEQALADFVLVIDELQKQHNKKRELDSLPVIAFGGSYGGMLSAWIRMKYPASVQGAIASSAPIWQFQGLTPCENYYKVTSSVYSILGGSKCSGTIRKSWSIIRSLAKSDDGKAKISKIWSLCNPIKTKDDVNTLIDWLGNIYVDIAMVNYPYPTNFLKTLPANPLREFCEKVKSIEYKDDLGLLKAIGAGINFYTNYTGKIKCVDTGKSADDLGEQGWNFQACTEMIMPMCSTDFDMFENSPWDFKSYSDHCFQTFGVRPRSEQVPVLQYGGKDITASNIVFSNGLLDPWSSGGVLSNLSPSLRAIVIPDGAHHFDLRAKNAMDTESVQSARKFHIKQIRKWLNEYYFKNLKDDSKLQFIGDNFLKKDEWI